jgi:NAD(P)-dependent dehydrogenase (short-subunit alcohol dehydrogenase family)
MIRGLLQGDTALVTGAASGIGRGVARALAAEGAHVVASDVNADAGATRAREIGGRFITADLSQPDAPAALFDAAIDAVGKPSISCIAPRPVDTKQRRCWKPPRRNGTLG